MIAIRYEKGFKTNGYKIVAIPKYTWAVFRADGLKDHGSDGKIHKLFNQAYSEWLPSSGYDRAARYAPDIEAYGDGFEEVWIPIINKS